MVAVGIPNSSGSPLHQPPQAVALMMVMGLRRHPSVPRRKIDAHASGYVRQMLQAERTMPNETIHLGAIGHRRSMARASSTSPADARAPPSGPPPAKPVDEHPTRVSKPSWRPPFRWRNPKNVVQGHEAHRTIVKRVIGGAVYPVEGVVGVRIQGIVVDVVISITFHHGMPIRATAAL